MLAVSFFPTDLIRCTICTVLSSFACTNTGMLQGFVQSAILSIHMNVVLLHPTEKKAELANVMVGNGGSLTGHTIITQILTT